MAVARTARLMTAVAVLCVVVWNRPTLAALDPAQQPVNPTAATQQAFQDRLKEYTALQQKLASALPALPKEATPAQLDAHQRELGKLMATTRKAAKRGDIFTPEMEALARTLLARVFSGPTGRQLLASIMDENPVGVVLKVNDRYPDSVPLSTMPPDVLQSLPKLPETLEYRFVGDRLVLLDVPAHLIADFVDNALPVK